MFWSKFLLKNVFLNDCNVCNCIPKARAQDYMPPLAPFTTPLYAKFCRPIVFQFS